MTDKQEPVAWIDEFGNVWPLGAWVKSEVRAKWKPLYRAATPAQEPDAEDEPIGVVIGFTEEGHAIVDHACEHVRVLQINTCVYAAPPAHPADNMQPLPNHDNHHNALKCPYCNPRRLVFAEPAAQPAPRTSEFEQDAVGLSLVAAWSVGRTDAVHPDFQCGFEAGWQAAQSAAINSVTRNSRTTEFDTPSAQPADRAPLERFNLDCHSDGIDQMREFVLASDHDQRVHDLETLCDPAGIVVENALLKQQTKELGAMIDRLNRTAAQPDGGYSCAKCGCVEQVRNDPPVQRPATWTDKEIAQGRVGIRWVNDGGVQGRPTKDDALEYIESGWPSAPVQMSDAQAVALMDLDSIEHTQGGANGPTIRLRSFINAQSGQVAPQPPIDNAFVAEGCEQFSKPAEPVRGLTDERIEAAIANYWDAAFEEGAALRKYDTEDGSAQKALHELKSAIEAAIVPPGYTVVPVEPTPEMVKAIDDVMWPGASAKAYRAMIAAAKQQPEN